MRRKEHYWSLFHFDRRKQLDDLRTDQLEAVFEALTESERARWFTWKEGFVGWKPFEEFPTLLQGLRKSIDAVDSDVKAPPPPNVSGPDFEKERDQFVLAELGGPLQLDERAPGRGAAAGRREGGGRRYSGEFDVDILGGGGGGGGSSGGGGQGRVRTRSVNASMSGLQLRDPLPVWAQRYFTIVVHGPDGGALKMLASAIRDASGGPSTRLKFESNDNDNLLRTWLLRL